MCTPTRWPPTDPKAGQSTWHGRSCGTLGWSILLLQFRENSPSLCLHKAASLHLPGWCIKNPKRMWAPTMLSCQNQAFEWESWECWQWNGPHPRFRTSSPSNRQRTAQISTLAEICSDTYSCWVGILKNQTILHLSESKGLVHILLETGLVGPQIGTQGMILGKLQEDAGHTREFLLQRSASCKHLFLP